MHKVSDIDELVTVAEGMTGLWEEIWSPRRSAAQDGIEDVCAGWGEEHELVKDARRGAVDTGKSKRLKINRGLTSIMFFIQSLIYGKYQRTIFVCLYS